MTTFKTIRQTAALGIISEFLIRKMVATGECPGFYSGNRFLVDVDALIEHLREKSGAMHKETN